MPIGKETIIRMRLKPHNKNVDMDLILWGIINLSQKDSIDLVPHAKELLAIVAKRGDDGLFSSDWQANAKALNISESQYFDILKKLKAAGIIYKSKGRYYFSKELMNHFKSLFQTLRNYLEDHGAI